MYFKLKDPQLPEKWEGVLECVKEGNDNPQMDTVFNKGFKGDEDSLYLNVYVPKGTKRDSKLPVMAFIHGGAFMMGSGSRELYGPDHLIQTGVILVTLNYRLGPLGFLCLNTPEVPGNAGLKDQTFALRWVKKNIKAFGGDPENVTIFGESAGSASVHFQILTPMAKGLFKKAIMQSGTSTCVWAKQKDPEKNAFDLARLLGMESNDKEAVLKFLRQVPAEDLAKITSKTFSATDIYNFLPIIEQSFTGVESFITTNPLELMATGNFNRVPLISGLTSQEGIVMLINGQTKIEDFSKVKSLSDTGLNLKEMLKSTLKSNDDNAMSQLAQKIEDFYFNRGGKVMENYIDLMSDMLFTVEIIKSINLQKKYHPIYCYMFTYSGGLNLFKLISSYPYTGASHGDDLGYLFKQNMGKLPEGVKVPEITQADLDTAKKFCVLWSNFAKYE